MTSTKNSLNKNNTETNLMSTAIGLLDFRSKSTSHFRAMNIKPFVSGANLKSQEFGDQSMPLRGTYYKSLNGL